MSTIIVLPEMLEKMRVKPDDDDNTMLSKKLSYVLRHGAKQLDLPVDGCGFVRVNDLLSIEELFGGVAEEALLEFVDKSNREKLRYETSMEGGSWRIRATGKHTIEGVDKPGGAGNAKDRRVENRGAATRRKEGKLETESEFCGRWKLDRIARARLAELPVNTRKLAMLQFSPGPQVRPADFPKVFVAFCKRFKEKKVGKDGDGSGAGDERRSREKKKRPEQHAGVAQARGEGDDDDDNEDGAFGNLGDEEGGLAAYPSPGSTPRSMEGGSPVHSQGLGLSCGSGSPLGNSRYGTSQDRGCRQVLATASPAVGRPVRMVQAPPNHSSRLAAPPLGTPNLFNLETPPCAPPPPAYAPLDVPMYPATAAQGLPRGAPPPPPAHSPQVARFPTSPGGSNQSYAAGDWSALDAGSRGTTQPLGDHTGSRMRQLNLASPPGYLHPPQQTGVDHLSTPPPGQHYGGQSPTQRQRPPRSPPGQHHQPRHPPGQHTLQHQYHDLQESMGYQYGQYNQGYYEQCGHNAGYRVSNDEGNHRGGSPYNGPCQSANHGAGDLPYGNCAAVQCADGGSSWGACY